VAFGNCACEFSEMPSLLILGALVYMPHLGSRCNAISKGAFWAVPGGSPVPCETISEEATCPS
jgi:hypothetical protein